MNQTKKPEPLVNLLYLNFSSPMENNIIYYILYLKVLLRWVDFERTYRCGQNTKYIRLLKKRYVNQVFLKGKTYSQAAASLLSRNYFKVFKIFPKLYCESLLIKGLHSYGLQTLRMNHPGLEHKLHTCSVVRPWPGSTFFSSLQLWQLVTLKPFYLQRPTVPL